jgi:eukaryotic translation initiation factor 2C
MEPTSKYPFNVRSFFTKNERKDLGNGIEAWRGYFQSVRPALGRMLVNIDISTGIMYKAGSLISLSLDYIGRWAQEKGPNVLAPSKGFPPRERVRLNHFLSGVKVVTTTAPPNRRTPRQIKKISDQGARQMTFKLREGGTRTVAEHFRLTYNRALQYPDLPCVEVSSLIYPCGCNL